MSYVDTEINIPKALAATNPTPAEFFDVIGATRNEWQTVRRGGWRAPGYLGAFREHGHYYLAVTVNERHFVIHETKRGQRYVYEFNSPAQCRGMLRIKKGNTDVETGAEFGHQRNPGAAKARLEESNDDGDDGEAQKIEEGTKVVIKDNVRYQHLSQGALLVNPVRHERTSQQSMRGKSFVTVMQVLVDEKCDYVNGVDLSETVYVTELGEYRRHELDVYTEA